MTWRSVAKGEETGMNGHRFRRLGAVAVLAMMLPLGVPASPPAAADVPDQVLVWNQHAYNELIGVKAQAPLALLHSP